MFDDLLRRLTAPSPAPLSDGDARLALGALMVRIARADGSYDADETVRIEAILARRYGLAAGAAAALRGDAEIFEAEAPDTVRFTRAIKEAVPYEDRLGVIQALWQVVLADGERDAREDAIMRLAAGLLGVSDVDSARARQWAQAGNA